MFAQHQPAGLQRAVNGSKGDARRLDEGHLEGHVVGDDAHAIEQVEDAGAGAVQVNDEDAIAAVVDLQKPDAGASWVETGGLGVLDRGRELLSLGDERRDLVAGALSFLSARSLPEAISLAFTRLASFST